MVVTGLGIGRRGEGVSGMLSSAPSLNRPVRPSRIDGTMDYHQLERPTYLRNQDGLKPQAAPVAIEERDREMEFLDIPAFLRKQQED